MAYKDKDKQRQAQKDWVRQKRGSTEQGSTPSGLTPEPCVHTEAKKLSVQAEHIRKHAPSLSILDTTPIPKHGSSISFKTVNGKMQDVHVSMIDCTPYGIWPDQYKPASQLAKGQHNVVALPGDADYVGVAQSHPEWPRTGQ